MPRRHALAAATLTLAAAASLAGPAAGTGGHGSATRHDPQETRVVQRGGCAGPARWKLTAKSEDGRIEVEGEVDSSVNGRHWRWRILHDGDMAFRGRATTRPPSGSFQVRRVVVDVAGSDRIGWRARNPRTHQRCRGGLTF